MWSVERLELRPRTLDFSSSGQGHCQVRALYGDDTRLVNAVSLLEFGDVMQVQICETCGVTHCEPGGWIAPRSLGDAVVWIPCFAQMMEEASGLTEYAPSGFARGFPLFHAAVYSRLRDLVPGFAEPTRLAPLSSREALRLLQLDAPARVLGRFPDAPILREELLVAASMDDIAAMLPRLRELIARAWSVDAAVSLTCVFRPS